MRRLLAFLLLVAGPLASLRAEPPVPPVEPAEFLPQLAAQLTAHFRPEQPLQLELLQAWRAPATPRDPWELRVVQPPAQLRAQNIVRVRLVSGERTLGEWNLALSAQLWGEALVLRRGVGRGEAFDAADCELRRTDFLRDRDAVPATAPLGGYAVRRPLDAGTVLAWRDLERRPLVLRGQSVEVSVQDGALSISMKARALQNGALGDTVTVRNPASNRDFSAEVVGPNQVRVTF